MHFPRSWDACRNHARPRRRVISRDETTMKGVILRCIRCKNTHFNSSLSTSRFSSSFAGPLAADAFALNSRLCGT